jgi:hypothetical protein
MSETTVWVPSVDGVNWVAVTITCDKNNPRVPVRCVCGGVGTTPQVINELNRLLSWAQFYCGKATGPQLTISMKPNSKPNLDVLSLALLLVCEGAITTSSFSLLAGVKCADNFYHLFDAPAPTNPPEGVARDLYCFSLASPQAKYALKHAALPPLAAKVLAPRAATVFYPVIEKDKETQLDKVTLGWFRIVCDKQVQGAENSFWLLSRDLGPGGVSNHFLNGIKTLFSLCRPTTSRFFIEHGGAVPSKGQESWSLALVAALQMAQGLMPGAPWPLVATGVLSLNETNYVSLDPEKTDKVQTKYDLLAQNYVALFSRLPSDANLLPPGWPEANPIHWQFAYPAGSNFNPELSAKILLTPVTQWLYEG